jgi:c-di-GMP-binding flagellar brake protein YcgR
MTAMIRETLAAIGTASSRAIYELTGQRPAKTQVTQMREWSFALPNLTRVTVANSPVHQIYVGMAKSLVTSLGKDEAARDRAHEELMEALKGQLLATLPVKRPIVRWERLDPSAEPRALRGMRSFILRHQTESGNLYLMTDLASRREFESMRDPDWESALGAQLLPEDVGRIECLEEPKDIDRLCTYLARCEHDLELLVPGNEGEVRPTSAVVIRRIKAGDHTLLQLSCDLDRREQDLELRAGLELEVAFGAAGRLFHFRTALAREAELELEGIEPLPVLEIELPRRVSLDQRRRYFRVPPEEVVRAHIEILVPESDENAEEELELDGALTGLVPEGAVEALVTDLSFAGAGVVLSNQAPGMLAVDSRVRIKFDGDEFPEPVAVTAEVRRLRVEPSGRGREATHLGLEFIVASVADRQATQVIRQYVMARQRNLLSVRSGDPAGAPS